MYDAECKHQTHGYNREEKRLFIYRKLYRGSRFYKTRGIMLRNQKVNQRYDTRNPIIYF